jgi:hypothetical protein
MDIDKLKQLKWNELDIIYEDLNKSIFSSSWANYDYTYRIYHGSFKMYYMADNTLILWDKIIYLFGLDTYIEKESGRDQKLRIKEFNKHVNHNLRQLNKLGISPVLERQLKLLKGKVFTFSKNRGDWGKEGVILAGLYKISQEIVESILIMLIDWKNKNGILWGEQNILSEHEALVMSTMKFLSIRTKKPDLEDTLKDIITKLN